MESRSRRIATTGPLLAAWLAFLTAPAAAQTSGQAGGSKPAAAPRRDRAKAGPKEKEKEKAAPAAKGDDKAARREPSPEFREGIRKTVEKRRQRRARRAAALGTDGGRPPGAIVPWPMPPALIIRQTPQAHDEIESFLGLLRRGG